MPPANVGLGQPRLEPRGLCERGQRLAVPLRLEQRAAPHRVGHRMAGVDPQRLVVRVERLGAAPRLGQGVAAPHSRVRVRRVAPGGLAERLGGVPVPAELRACDRAPHVAHRLAGIRLDGRLEHAHGLGQARGGHEHGAAHGRLVVAGDAEAGRRVELGERAVGAPGVCQGSGQVHAGRAAAGVAPDLFLAGGEIVRSRLPGGPVRPVRSADHDAYARAPSPPLLRACHAGVGAEGADLCGARNGRGGGGEGGKKPPAAFRQMRSPCARLLPAPPARKGEWEGDGSGASPGRSGCAIFAIGAASAGRLPVPYGPLVDAAFAPRRAWAGIVVGALQPVRRLSERMPPLPSAACHKPCKPLCARTDSWCIVGFELFDLVDHLPHHVDHALAIVSVAVQVESIQELLRLAVKVCKVARADQSSVHAMWNHPVFVPPADRRSQQIRPPDRLGDLRQLYAEQIGFLVPSTDLPSSITHDLPCDRPGHGDHAPYDGLHCWKYGPGDLGGRLLRGCGSVHG